jgi:RNA polymerase sigma-70 factor (ECF subfamily)
MTMMREEDLEDIVENVIAKIYMKYKSLEIDNILAYVYRMLDNEIKDHWKKKYREKIVDSDENEIFPERIESDQSLEDIVINQDLVDNIRKALQTLHSPKKKKIFELKLMGYDSKEIMEKLNLSRSAFDTIVFRATQDLKKYLTKQEVKG